MRIRKNEDLFGWYGNLRTAAFNVSVLDDFTQKLMHCKF